MQFLNAERRSGIELLFDMQDLDSILANADLIITGEGHADRQTLMGKAPVGILNRAKAQDVPVVLLAGQVDEREALLQAGFDDVVCINEKGLPLEEAMKNNVAFNHIKDALRFKVPM